jgi:hypothetical protein
LPFGLLLFFGFQSLYCMRGKKKKTEQWKEKWFVLALATFLYLNYY